MSTSPIRRAHLIAPFGTGSILVAPDGTAMMAAGLDHWYRYREDGTTADIELQEYKFHEWRLQARLGVDHFRLPPDYRTPQRGRPGTNTRLTVPFLRFPRWHFCWRCRRLEELPLTVTGRQRCGFCRGSGKRSFLAQVPFVVMCDRGHLQDFPWRDWVHGKADTQCAGEMRLETQGGGTLADQVVRCSCGRHRSLARIVESKRDVGTSFLSEHLDEAPDVQYLCRAVSPQHGSTARAGECGRPLHGSLRSSSNLYFADVRSAIYLPSSASNAPSDLRALLDTPQLAVTVNEILGAALHSGGANDQLIAVVLRARAKEAFPRSEHNSTSGPEIRNALADYSDDELVAAARDAFHDRERLPGIASGSLPRGQASSDDAEDDDESTFRIEESDVLRQPQASSDLTVATTDHLAYGGVTRSAFDRVRLVERLRETRILVGFDRVFPQSSLTASDKRGQLWAASPAPPWLPGYIVHGEGLYLELAEPRVRAWEALERVQERVARLQLHYSGAQQARGLPERHLSARFVLVHTLAHVLMNQMTVECGYSTAALRERLYVSSSTDRARAAFMIYTAAGDAEGTMGGLVRMGRPTYLERVVDGALEASQWCASDPVCMEIGSSVGQGPDSCNLAACHTCTLVPETACEEFNRFLDRGLLIGSIDDPDLGFFSS